MAEPLDVRALLDGTTPGPWFIEGDYIMDKYRARLIVMLGHFDPEDQYAENDAALVAAAPALAARVLELEGEVAGLRETLVVYADPGFYHAIGFGFDRPCGDFADDFSEDHADPFYDRPMPGAAARAALRVTDQEGDQ